MADRDLVVKKSTEKIFDLECGPCKRDNRILQASGFCSDCSEFLCEECFRTHCRPLPSRHHILLEANDMPKNKTATRATDVSTEKCPRHTGQLIEYYCPKDNFLGCSICITLHHRACEGVVYIPDEIDGLFQSEEYLNMTKSLQTILKHTDDNAKYIDISKLDSQRIHDSSKDELKQFRNKINACIDKLEGNIEQESKRLYKQNMSAVEEVNKKNEILGEKIKNILDNLNKKETMRKGIDSYIAIKKYTKTVNLFEKEAKDVRNKIKIKDYYFECDAVQTAFGKLAIEEVPVDGIELARAMYVGARVQPGKDWKGELKNAHYGTVYSKYIDLTVNVGWDNAGIGVHSVGYNSVYELMFVPGTYRSNHQK